MTQRQPDAGFTMVELLIVLVIMPLVIGAIAAAIIISEQDSGVASSRLSDSANAQIASEYYIRDVQGAQYVTTTNVQSPYSVQSPQVCLNPALSSPTPILGLYRPAISSQTTTAPALAVGYWETTGASAQLVRDSCSINSSGLSSLTDQVVISDDISPTGASATISPSNFASDASYGWTPIAATTSVQNGLTLPSGTFTLQVASTSGFQSGVPMNVRSSAGTQTITCTAPTPPGTQFTGCTTFGSGKVAAQAVLYQKQNITSVSISVTEPGSGYTYTLQASPRTSAARTTGVPTNGAGTGAAMVSLGDVTLSGDATLNVQGAVDINGSLNTAGLTGGGFTNGTPNVGPVTDPLEPFLPTSVTTTGNIYDASNSPCTYPAGLSTPAPGEYQCPLVLQRNAVLQLSAGVYQLDDGITVNAHATLSAGAGTLLYLPCQGSCNETAIFKRGATVNIQPLTATEALAASGNTGTGLADVWFWQASNGTGTTLIGNGQGPATTGIAYAPTATIDLSNSSGTDSVGEIVAQDVTMEPPSGSATLLVTGQ